MCLGGLADTHPCTRLCGRYNKYTRSYRPRLSDKFCNQSIFQNFRHWGVNQSLGIPAFSLSSPSPQHSHFPPPLLQSLRSSPRIQLEGLGSAVSYPSDIWGGAPAEIEFGFLALKSGIWLQQIKKIFLIIKSPNFMQHFQILC